MRMDAENPEALTAYAAHYEPLFARRKLVYDDSRSRGPMRPEYQTGVDPWKGGIWQDYLH